MRLLIITQTVDLDDPVLGFFHGWIVKLATKCEHIEVICLREGNHNLPKNVTVHSLGKERGASKIACILNFYRYAWRLRHTYNAVFVHMNQEYVLLGGLLWRLFGKKVYLWRNHYAGTFFTNIAVALSDSASCTSKYSYTARFKKTTLMPVGIDTDLFTPVPGIPRTMSVLSLGRIAPSKRLGMLVEALAILKDKGVTISGDIYGDALPRDRKYREQLIADVETRGLSSHIHFHPGVPNKETPRIYSAHDIFVNCSRSGMYDKTIFEAAACGTIPLATSLDYAGAAGERFSFTNSSELAAKLEILLSLPAAEKEELRANLKDITVREHSLDALAKKLSAEMF